MIKNKIKYLALFVSLTIFISCDKSVVEPNEYDNASLTYIQSGGFAGVYEKLYIDNSRVSYYQSKTFSSTLLYQLTEAEFKEIQSFYKNFAKYNSNYPGDCIDDFHYQLIVGNSGKEKTIEFDACAFDKYSELDKMRSLVSKLNALRTKIYEENETWEGLTYDFYTDKKVYSNGEQIVFSCKIKNPTESLRSIYFKNQHKIQFSINNDFKPKIQFRMPSTAVINSDSLGGMLIPLRSNEEIIIDFPWDQKFTNYTQDLYNSLPAGEYTSTIYLKGGNYPLERNIMFQIN